MEQNYDFEWAKTNFRFMECNPQHILSHMNIYDHLWLDSVFHVIEYLEKQMDESISEEERVNIEPVSQDVIGHIKLGLMFLPAIVYYEDNPITAEIHKALCLICYNFGLIADEPEILELYKANAVVWEQKDTIRELITVAESIMMQHQSCQISNESAEPYQLSIDFLRALTASAKEKAKENE